MRARSHISYEGHIYKSSREIGEPNMSHMWESHMNESHHIEESRTHGFARHMRVTYGSHMNEFARIRRAKYGLHVGVTCE